MAPQKSPAFSFYAKDFLSGTAKMSLQEVGAYIRLLSYAWEDGCIPEDASERARLMVCAKAQERELWKKVGQKFVLRDGGYVNERLEVERQKQAERRQRLSDNGKLGGRPGKANEKLNESKGFLSAKADANLDERLSSSSSSSKEQVPASKERSLPVGFEEWYRAYPKHVAKGAALKAWTKINPTTEVRTHMLDALKWQRTQPQWLKDGGAYVPNPATYLNAAQWQDEPFFAAPEPVRVSAVQSRHEQMLANIEAGVYRG